MRRRLAAFAVSLVAAGTLSPSRDRAVTLVLDVNSVVPNGSIPVQADVRSTAHTLEDFYATVGITILRRDATLKAPGPHSYTDSELHALLAEVKPIAPVDASAWYVRAFVVPSLVSDDGYDVVGVMFDQAQRRAFAVAAGNNPAMSLRTAAHELGHALNLFHSDGDADPQCCAGDRYARRGTSIMNEDTCLTPDWDFVFSSAEKAHLTQHPVDYVRPGGCFGVCIAGHADRCPTDDSTLPCVH